MNPMDYTPEAMAKLTPAEKEEMMKKLNKNFASNLLSITAVKVGIAIAIWIAVKKLDHKAKSN